MSARRPSWRELLLALAGRQDLLVAIVLVLAVAMMVIPMPTLLVDVMIAVNLSASVLLLMVTLYLRSPLDFSVLPALILVSTMFRLALSITTTRLILVQADAGHIVATFGQFVIAGNVVVGLVVFLIITVVQFLVVTKGAERVAEVGARFTLDAMPGKQMSIDADLRNGDIDQQEARHRRHLLERESQLHGAMDGAMKFVKGDAIAGLVIIVINLIGGLSIGMVQRGMPFGDAVHLYALLTVGDAMISQIPALTLSIASGIMVTRVGGESSGNLGEDIVAQMGASRRALQIAAVVIFGMAAIPGFPAPVFVVLAAILGFAAWRGGRTGQARESAQPEPSWPEDEGTPDDAGKPAALGRPGVVVALAPDLAAALDDQRLQALILRARTQVDDELGIACPEVVTTEDPSLGPGTFCVLHDGVPVEQAEVRPDQLLLRDDEAHAELAGIAVVDGPKVPGMDTHRWVDAASRETLVGAGIGFSDAAQIVAAVLRRVLRRLAPAFVGIQETKDLLQRTEKDYAELVREAQRVMPIQKIGEVLRRLLEEGIPIRNVRSILESITEWAERETRVLIMVEHVRSGLKRQICHRYANAQKVLPAFVLDQEAENAVRAGLRESVLGIHLALDPPVSERLVGSLRRQLAAIRPEHARPVVICSLDIRRFVHGLLVKNELDIPVLSYQELAPEFPVVPLGSVSVAAPGTRPTAAGRVDTQVEAGVEA